MSYPPRWNEGHESDADRRRERRRNEDPRFERERERSESLRYGRPRRDDDEGAFDSPHEEWQQPRRIGGYYEDRRFGSELGGQRRSSSGGGYGEHNFEREAERFSDWEQQRRYGAHPEGQRFGREYSRDSGRARFGDFSDRDQQRGFAGRGPKNYKRSDQRIQEEVCDRLTSDADVDASEIQVDVKNGEVTLDGTVSERGMKRCAEECIEDVSGVTQVHNRLRIAQGQSSQGMQGSQSSESWGQQRGEPQRADLPGTSQSRPGRLA